MNDLQWKTMAVSGNKSDMAQSISPKNSSSADESVLLGPKGLALDEELRRLDSLAAETGRLSLHSQKGILRAGKALEEAAEVQTRIGQRLGELTDAIAANSARQQATIAKLELGRKLCVTRRNT